MKVVLFCGGLGTRMRDYSEAIPKPLVHVGARPILLHVMKYYAHHGHQEFILCLGWKGEAIKNFFLSYNECLSNDFILSQGGRSIQLLRHDIENWKITFVDTGMLSSIGQRLKAVEPYLAGEETFLANYTDGLSDVPLPSLIERHRATGAVATFMSVRPSQTFHCVTADEHGCVRGITAVTESPMRINAGFFVFQQEIFAAIKPGEELVEQPFQRLIARNKLYTLPYDGFYGCMDTFKEKQMLDDMHFRGETPWEVWQRGGTPG